jgi:CPA2 family monovalent cation:H+ antiporter-2
VPFVVADQSRERVEALRADGCAAVLGDASEPAELIQAHIARARMLVIAVPDSVGVRRMIEVARTLNPVIQIVVRSHSDEQAERLRQDGAAEVFLGERELARAMTRHILDTAPKKAAGTPH